MFIKIWLVHLEGYRPDPLDHGLSRGLGVLDVGGKVLEKGGVEGLTLTAKESAGELKP